MSYNIASAIVQTLNKARPNHADCVLGLFTTVSASTWVNAYSVSQEFGIKANLACNAKYSESNKNKYLVT